MRKDWQDPRDGTTWVIRICEPATLPTGGPSLPRVISFRRQTTFEVYSTDLAEAVSVQTFSDLELQQLLDRARTRLQHASGA